MDKLSYGAYDNDNIDCAFIHGSYTDPLSETQARKMLSYPLKEIKEYINKTVSIDSQGNALQLKLDYENSSLYYSLDGTNWLPVDFYGGQGEPGEGVPEGGTFGQFLMKSSSTDYDTEWATVDVETQINTAIRNVFPIGYVYISVDPTNPSTYFAGTWQQITSDAYLKIVNSDGGALGGTSNEHKIPVESLPSHNHSYSDYATYSTDQTGAYSPTSYINQYVGSPTSTGRTTGNKGGGQAYYPYYLGVYVWKRVA